MNTLLLKKFTPEIIRGAKTLGVDFDTHRDVLGTQQAEAIEEKTGRSIGELALLGIQADALPAQQKQQRELVQETIELMAAFDSRPSVGRATVIEQPAVRR